MRRHWLKLRLRPRKTSRSWPIRFPPQTEPQIEERIIGNPNLHPEVAYEWTYGAVYSPKWVKGLTLSADWWHIDMRDIVATIGRANHHPGKSPDQHSGASTVQEHGPIVFRAPGDSSR